VIVKKYHFAAYAADNRSRSKCHWVCFRFTTVCGLEWTTYPRRLDKVWVW